MMVRVSALAAVVLFFNLGATVSAGASCTWQSMPMMSLQAPAVVSSISAASPSDVWAVGYFTRNTGYEHAFAERFDGSAWSVVPVTGLSLGAVRTFGTTDAWAIGTRNDRGFIRTLAVHYDGTAWSAVPTPNANNSSNVLDAIAGSSTDDLWAVGSYFDPNNHATLTLAEHWNGRVWSLVPTPDVGLQSLLLGAYASGPNDVWAVGYHDSVGGTNGGLLIEHWNGSRWRVVSAPMTPFSAFTSLEAAGGSSADDVWAVGVGFMQGSRQSATLAIHWDGTRWKYEQSPNVGAQSNLLDGVVSDAAGHAVAVGSSAAGRSALVERWNGEGWSVDRSARSPQDSQLNAIALDPTGLLWAGGYAGRQPFDEFDCGG